MHAVQKRSLNFLWKNTQQTKGRALLMSKHALNFDENVIVYTVSTHLLLFSFTQRLRFLLRKNTWHSSDIRFVNLYTLKGKHSIITGMQRMLSKLSWLTKVFFQADRVVSVGTS
jgi:outer membrane biogenesis lipoprotein LolB